MNLWKEIKYMAVVFMTVACLSLTITSSHAGEVYGGIYGTVGDEGSQAVYNDSKGGVILWGTWRNLALDFFIGEDEGNGADIRGFFDVGGFRYSAGAGVYSDYATVSDATGNWDHTTIQSHPDYFPAYVLQARHDSGFFVRYMRYTFENDYHFIESDGGATPRTSGGVSNGATIIDSKTVPVSETRNKLMIGFSVRL